MTHPTVDATSRITSPAQQQQQQQQQQPPAALPSRGAFVSVERTPRQQPTAIAAAIAAARRSHAAPALGRVLAMTSDWLLSPPEECALLGAPNSETLLGWRHAAAALPPDAATRAALLLDIAQLLRSPALGLDAHGRTWVRIARADGPFQGRAPLAFMLAGGIPALAHVRCHLEAAIRARTAAATAAKLPEPTRRAGSAA